MFRKTGRYIVMNYKKGLENRGEGLGKENYREERR